MGYEVLVILFIVLSVVSSLINKMQEQRKKQDSESTRRKPAMRPPRPMPRRPVVIEEEELDLSEWEILPELKPQPPTPPPGEFREVRGATPVSEPAGGEEFREVRGTREVSEADTGPEFREVRGTRRVIEPSPYVPTPPEEEVAPPAEEIEVPTLSPRRKRRTRLRFSRSNLRNAILYREIIGPPRAEQDY
jgi:hypothetical protein